MMLNLMLSVLIQCKLFMLKPINSPDDKSTKNCLPFMITLCKHDLDVHKSPAVSTYAYEVYCLQNE
ncbi:CLUMA_CG009709, isoform A [Clunio marinus]|uniref:CLUMA_CG009709, isoform A n=1 Tax=Clunio marinus TaxID=568069 RepID=A0A1J1I7K2_9DIPT|nr:CLUMA_CG009709, isoform A [Clunio marinus]